MTFDDVIFVIKHWAKKWDVPEPNILRRPSVIIDEIKAKDSADIEEGIEPRVVKAKSSQKSSNQKALEIMKSSPFNNRGENPIMAKATKVTPLVSSKITAHNPNSKEKSVVIKPAEKNMNDNSTVLSKQTQKGNNLTGIASKLKMQIQLPKADAPKTDPLAQPNTSKNPVRPSATLKGNNPQLEKKIAQKTAPANTNKNAAVKVHKTTKIGAYQTEPKKQNPEKPLKNKTIGPPRKKASGII